METITIRVKKHSSKSKQLLGLIQEMAADGELQIQKMTTHNEVRRGIRDMKFNRVKPIDTLFE